MSEGLPQSKDNNTEKKSWFMLNYNAMVLFFFIAFLAYKIESLSSVIIALIGFVLSSPSIQFPKNSFRWISLLIIIIILIVIFPDLSLLKSKI